MDDEGVVRINSNRCEINDKGELICETPDNVEVTEETDVMLLDSLKSDKPKPTPKDRGVEPNSNITV